MEPGLSIVIPTLDDGAALGRALPRALAEATEVVVVDGGSLDTGPREAARHGASVVTAPPGRGAQLARGAQAASGDLLLFLHADTLLPEGAASLVREALAAGAIAGGFPVRFDEAGPLLRLGAALINLRTRLTRIPLGDQAQFTTRAAYEAAGGFRDWPILEDLDLMRRLKHLGRIALVKPPVVTSSRRFRQRGIARTVATNWLIWGLYFAGASPSRLARLYGTVR